MSLPHHYANPITYLTGNHRRGRTQVPGEKARTSAPAQSLFQQASDERIRAKGIGMGKERELGEGIHWLIVINISQ